MSMAAKKLLAVEHGIWHDSHSKSRLICLFFTVRYSVSCKIPTPTYLQYAL